MKTKIALVPPVESAPSPSSPALVNVGTADRAADPPRRALADFNSMRPMKPHTTEEALQLESGAAMQRAIGQAMIAEDGDHIEGRFALAQADSMEAAAAAFMDPATHVTGPVRPGNGGELIVVTREAWANIPGVVDTVRESPDMVTATASRRRLELAGNSLTLAVDAAQTIGARNSLERMLAHQLAASHRLAMVFAEKAADIVERHGALSQMQSVEACRLAGAAGRMMSTYQEGYLALDRIRRGGRQTVKVVHVHQQVAVAPGGRAVVAGTVKGGRGLRAGGGARKNGR